MQNCLFVLNISYTKPTVKNGSKQHWRQILMYAFWRREKVRNNVIDISEIVGFHRQKNPTIKFWLIGII